MSLWLWSLCRPLTDCGHCVPPSPPAARAQPGVWCLPVQWGQSRHRVYTQPLATVTLTQAERVVSPCKLHSRILKIITLISEKDKTKYAAYIKQTHSRCLDRRRSCYSVQVYTDGWRHGMMYRCTVTGTGCTVTTWVRCVTGGGRAQISVLHIIIMGREGGQAGARARQHFTGLCCHGPGLHSGVTLGSQLP